jgi:hypothetical protein
VVFPIRASSDEDALGSRGFSKEWEEESELVRCRFGGTFALADGLLAKTIGAASQLRLKQFRKA